MENPLEFNDQLKTFVTIVKQKSKKFPEKNQLIQIIQKIFEFLAFEITIQFGQPLQLPFYFGLFNWFPIFFSLQKLWGAV